MPIAAVPLRLKTYGRDSVVASFAGSFLNGKEMSMNTMRHAMVMKSYSRRACFGLLLLVCLWASGCHKEEEPVVEETFKQTYPVQPDVHITLKNTDGSFYVYGSGKSEVQVEAIKKAYGRERLGKIQVNVTNTPGIFSIDTVYPPKPKLGLGDRSGTVDYVIIVPQTCTISRLDVNTGEVIIDGLRGGGVSASLVNGRMFNHNCFGQQQLFVANGALDVSFEWWETRKFSVEARILNGNLRATIPSDGQFHLVAKTIDGNISNDFSEQEDRHRGFTRSVDSIVGENAQTEITLQATNGNIKIAQYNP
jgi:hypothetical protein